LPPASASLPASFYACPARHAFVRRRGQHGVLAALHPIERTSGEHIKVTAQRLLASGLPFIILKDGHRRTHGMTDYWCRFLDRASRAYAGEKFHCADLAEAITKARLILREGEGIGFEIWENSQRIYAERP
jgi:hypothetical protein